MYNMMVDILDMMDSNWNPRLSRVMVFNNTFNNISVISQWSVLLVEETRVPVENHHKSLTNLIT